MRFWRGKAFHLALLLSSLLVSSCTEIDDLKKAAEQGDADAQFNLGCMYADGEGVAEDSAEAVKWWLKAAEQGDADAQNNLGAMYDNGQGVAEDDVEAVKWYRKAAEQRTAMAQNNLGYMYDQWPRCGSG
tara:strand:+ start:144 stop:533 length:390 start_codon:yes stop_codon:yes gene_type:complete